MIPKVYGIHLRETNLRRYYYNTSTFISQIKYLKVYDTGCLDIEYKQSLVCYAIISNSKSTFTKL